MPSQYKQINGVRYERELLSLADGYKEAGLGLPEVQVLWSSAMDGRGITETERRTLEYIMKEHPLDGAAKTFLEDKLGKLPAGSGTPKSSGYGKEDSKGSKKDASASPIFSSPARQYKQIDGVRYEADLLRIAEKNEEDGLGLPEAQALWAAALDGRRVTKTEMRTLEYIMATYPLDEAADALLGDKLGRAEVDAPGRDEASSASLSDTPVSPPTGDGGFAPTFYNPGASKIELEELLQFLRSASHSLDVAVFALTDDRLAGALLERHTAGVRVRVIADDEQEKAFDTSDLEALRKAGIEVRIDNSKFHMHHKFAVVDNKACVNGSLNWTTGAIRNNRENIVICSRPDLAMRFTTEFERLWTAFAPGKGAGSGTAPDGIWDSNCAVLFFPDTDDANLRTLVAEVETAMKTLDVCVFTLTMRELKDAMVSAHMRGARVRIITDDRQAKCHKGAHVKELKEAGIQLRTDNNGFANMHHKFCVVDGRTVCNGSFNWTRQAEDGNQENVIVFRDDVALAARFTQEFDSLWAEFA